MIRAPGGAGKTVLMVQWVSEQDAQGIWVTVEPDIGARAALWNAVFDAASSAGIVPSLRLEDGADRELLRATLLRAFRTVTEPFVLVIDDAHELTDPLIFDDLIALLRAVPSVQAVVGTRTHGDLEAPRHALILDVSVLGPDELVLTAEDVESIVGVNGARIGTPDELLEASGGNPLLLRAIVAGSSAITGAHSSARAVVLDYLRNTFSTSSGELATFASASAIPDDADVALAARLSGLAPKRVGELFSVLENDGLAMRRDTPDGVRFRFHPLVREVLRSELRSNDPERFRSASLLVSAAAEARHHYLPALRHAVDAEDYSRASDVCFHGGFTLIRSRGAAAIIQQVPLRYVARLPFLAVVLGLAANARGDRWKALQLLTLALGASRAGRSRQRVAERIGLALIETVILRITGRATDSVAPARRMLTLLDDAAPPELEEIAEQIGSYRLQAAVSLFKAGRFTEARIAAEQVGVSAHALAQGSPESLGAASLIAAIAAVRGECVVATAALADIDASDYPVEQKDGYVGSLAHLARGILALESGNPETAATQLDLFVARENLEHGTLFSVTRALVELWRGAPDVGLRALETRQSTDRPRARVSPEDRFFVAVARVLLSSALGQMGPAYEALREIDRTTPAATLLRAHLYLLEQRPDLVIEQLTGTTFPPEPRLRAVADLLMAVAALMRDDTALAESALRRFFATLQVNRTLSPVVLIPAERRARLYEFAAEIGAKDVTIERLRSVPTPFHTTVMLAALTPRESEVLEQLRRTASLVEIAATLHVSSNTVKTQVRSLYRKLGVSGRDEAIRTAYLQGLLLAEPQLSGE